MKISWVTIDRICQEEADAKENVRREHLLQFMASPKAVPRDADRNPADVRRPLATWPLARPIVQP